MLSAKPKLLIATALCSLACSCTSTIVSVSSVPSDADVVLVTASGERTLGKTPYDFNLDKESTGSDKSVHVVVRKDNYHDQSVLLPKSLSPATHKMSLRLAEKPSTTPVVTKEVECPKQDDATPRVARAVAEAQSLISLREYETASLKLEMVISQHPNIAILHDLRGNVYFLQRNFSEALKAYEKSLLIEPNNPEAQRMISRVRGLMGLPETER